MVKKTIIKVLSRNDTGETGAHQAGLVIPRQPSILSFFPELNPEERNPRVHLRFTDAAAEQWEFAFVYYNNALFGGTRNEYRLTRMTKFIRQAGLVSGDTIELTRQVDGEYTVSYRRRVASSFNESGKTILRLGSSWKVIHI